MRFSVWREGKKVADHTGDVLFTHLGLSGPGILDASRGIRPGDMVRLSFAGTMRREEFAADIAKRAAENPGWQVGTILAKYPIPERLNRNLLKISGIPEDLKCAHFSAAQRAALVTNCTEFPLTVSALGDYKIAMATRGGVALDGVNAKTMESKTRARPFFCWRGAGHRWRYRRLQSSGRVLDRVPCGSGDTEESGGGGETVLNGTDVYPNHTRQVKKEERYSPVRYTGSSAASQPAGAGSGR